MSELQKHVYKRRQMTIRPSGRPTIGWENKTAKGIQNIKLANSIVDDREIKDVFGDD